MTATQNANTALITGASSGIGAVYADRLAARGHDLILVARNADRLGAVAARIRERRGRAVRLLPADLATTAGMRAVETVLRTDSGIVMLVNNAGVAAVTPLLQSDVERMSDMIALNITALTRLTYAAVPGLVARGGGTIINVSSVVAVAPELLNGVYGGSKAFVLAFSRSLRKELAEKGVRVQAVLPGVTATDLWDKAGKPVSELPQSWVMSTDDMVDAALAGLDAGEFATLPGLHDAADWESFEAARQAMMSKLSNAKPAARYLRVAAPA